VRLAVVADTAIDTEERPNFDAFWLLCPKRVAKLDAKKAWDRLSAEDQLAAMVGMVAWRRVWMARDLQYAPYPATWLNGHRWEDELPTNWGASHASHAEAQIPQSGERAQMPAHVKDVLAKLRVKKP
jgi:hypothetical protein